MEDINLTEQEEKYFKRVDELRINYIRQFEEATKDLSKEDRYMLAESIFNDLAYTWEPTD